MLGRILTIVMSMLVIAGSAAAVELRDATNAQILDELAYRLRSGGGGSVSARAIFSCDSSTYMQISVVGASGNEETAQLYVGSPSTCASQAQTLNSTRARIIETVVAAVCDSSTYLHRYSITPQGNLSELQSRYVGNPTTCMQQADTINRG